MANVDYILKLSEHFCKIARYFDLEEFGSLPTGIENGRLSPQRHEMLSQLPISGIGGSRNTCILNSKKALKVAKTPRGLEGNKIEFENLKKYDSVWLPKVYNRADDFSWIVVELVRPLLNLSEIEELIGVDGELFDYLMGDRDYYSSFQNLIETIFFDLKENGNLKYSRFDSNTLKACLNNKFLMELDKLIKKFSLSSVEFTDIDNLGKSASGHLVLLDIGELKE